MVHIRIILLCLFISVSFISFGQNSRDNQTLEEKYNFFLSKCRDNYIVSNDITIMAGIECIKVAEECYGKEAEQLWYPLIYIYMSYAQYAELNWANRSKNLNRAIKYCTKAINLYKNGYDIEIYGKMLSDISGYYVSLEDYYQAIRFGSKALDIKEQIHGKTNQEYATLLNKIAGYNANIGNYSEAIRLGLETLDLREQILGKTHREYITSLRNLAYYYADSGNYSEAIRFGSEALKLEKAKVRKKINIDYVILLNDIARFYAKSGKYSEAIRFGSEVLKLEKKIYGKDRYRYTSALSNLASYYAKSGNYSKAIRLASEALECEKAKTHSGYGILLRELASYYALSGKYSEAIRLIEKSLKECRYDHTDYVMSLSDLTLLNFLNRDFSEMEEYAILALVAHHDNVRLNFKVLTSNERRDLWDREKSWYEYFIHQYTYAANTPTMFAKGCDAILMSKGILLGTEMDFNQLITESGDMEALEKWEKLHNIRIQIDRIYEEEISNRSAGLIDSLNYLANRLEVELVERSKAYGDFTRNMNIRWRDISKKLGAKDVAFEFVTIPVDDKLKYAAYVIEPEEKNPVLETVFDDSELKEIIKKGTIYSSTDLSRILWSRLSGYIEGRENIYFSPAGELYNIAIESVPHYEKGGLISDYHRMHRLSSTRQLAVTGNDLQSEPSAALFGGLNYNCGYDAVSKGVATERGGFENLPATIDEVKTINGMMQRKAIKSDLFTEDAGTEAAFRSLSGKKKSIIHIATHGEYYSDRDVRLNADRSQFMQSLLRDRNASGRHEEDKALTRSWLMLSGGNATLTERQTDDESTPIEKADDGILSAKEVSELDLRGLDLLVLSACKTGLGDVTGEGVFGLQRGFKKAGANSLLMSLWKVNDSATQMLMVNFYKNLLEGNTKRESLLMAQKSVRDYQENGVRIYADPIYWAAFILLDGLD